MIVHYNIKIIGIVQGVFFRASTQKEADKLDLFGFVRNEPNGSVYIEVEGEEENLKQFIRWCKKGPASAKVDEVDLKKGNIKNYEKFIIK